MSVRRASLPIRSLVGMTLALLLVSGCAELTGSSSPRAIGPFDPGQSSIPEDGLVTTLCGNRVSSGLRQVSDAYYELASEWERFTAYADGIAEGDVTPEEFDGVDQRRRLVVGRINDYLEAAETLRWAGARSSTPDPTACDRDVMVLFEKVYQEHQAEIDYVEKTVKTRTGALRKAAGVPED